MSVLVGYVPTPEGRAALRRAVLESRLRDTELIVALAARSTGAADEVGCERELREVCTELHVEPPVHRALAMPEGADPAEHLVTTADRTGADVLVIGLRRRSPVGKLVLGSIAQRVLLDAPCAVLAVKIDPEAAGPGRSAGGQERA